MRPNGKYFAVRAVLFVLCTVSLLSAMGSAETVHGKFKLLTETRWGKVLLAPGDYEFTISDTASIRVVTVRSQDSGWSALILPESTSDPSSARGTSLQLVKSEGGAYVRSLALGDLGMTLNFGAPTPGKVGLAPTQAPQVASASGSH